METIHQDEPVRAVKLARWDHEHPGRFLPVHVRFSSYPIEAEARCQFARLSQAQQECFSLILRPDQHMIPDPYCTCGFYAWKPDWKGDVMFMEGFLVALLVELYGKVIEHEKGYRAQYQRVLRIGVHYASDLPWFREHYPTEITALMLVSHREGYLTPSWATNALVNG